MKTTNNKCRQYVEQLIPFKASNLSGVFEHNFYVVYSYAWYPILAYDISLGVWYENSDKISASTSRQLSQCAPEGECRLVSHDDIRGLINGSITLVAV